MADDKYAPIQFDAHHMNLWAKFKKDFDQLETRLNLFLKPSRELSIALTKLEEVHMWTNKAIKKNQLILGDKNGNKD